MGGWVRGRTPTPQWVLGQRPRFGFRREAPTFLGGSALRRSLPRGGIPRQVSGQEGPPPPRGRKKKDGTLLICVRGFFSRRRFPFPGGGGVYQPAGSSWSADLVRCNTVTDGAAKVGWTKKISLQRADCLEN